MLRKGDFTTPRQPVFIRERYQMLTLISLFFAPVILANNFDILLGQANVTVPWVEDGDDYQVVGEFTPFSSVQTQYPDCSQ